MGRRIEVYSVDGFLHGDVPIRVEGGIPDWVAHGVRISVLSVGVSVAVHTFAPSAVVYAMTNAPVSTAFDHKIWPLFLDIGKPLAKTFIALGIYRCMRNDVDKGWKMIYRAGLGLVGLYLVDGGIHILTSIGDDLTSA